MSAPIAFMRRCAFDKNEGTRGNRPKGWVLHATSLIKILPHDVPLYAAQPESVRDTRAALADAIEALKPFAEKEMHPNSGNRPDDWREPFGFALGDLRRAAQVVAKHGGGR